MRCSTGLAVRAFVGRFVGAAEVRLIGLGVKEVGAGVGRDVATAGSIVGGRLRVGWFVPGTGSANGGSVGLMGPERTGGYGSGFVGRAVTDGSFERTIVGGGCGFEGHCEGVVVGRVDDEGYADGDSDLEGALEVGGCVEGKRDEYGFSVFMVRVVGRIVGFRVGAAVGSMHKSGRAFLLRRLRRKERGGR
jgi:hypothetical protein